MNIQLSDHFDYRRLLRFALPSIFMMICTSVYSVVDGFFVSNYVGKIAFAAINLIMPVLMILGVIGTMIGTGGSALVAKLLGEGKKEKANRVFSMLVCMAICLGVLLSVVGYLSIERCAIWLGAEGEMAQACGVYGRMILLALPAYILQYMFQAFLITAERPTFGLVVTITAGVANMILDYLLIVRFHYGLEGAAVATAVSQVLGGVIPLVYFAITKRNNLRLVKPHMDGKALIKTLYNGSSEFVTNISVSVVAMLYNFQLMRMVGVNGVAAYGVIMYVNFLFLAIFFGYSIGVAPVISYHFGAQNHPELKNLLRKSLFVMAGFGLLLTSAAEVFANPLARLFVDYDEELMLLTRRGFRIYSLSYLIVGINMFGSAFFTALNNGLVSATISFSRTMLFEACAVLLLPLAFGMDGIWSSVVVAEMSAAVVSVLFLVKMRKRYGY